VIHQKTVEIKRLNRFMECEFFMQTLYVCAEMGGLQVKTEKVKLRDLTVNITVTISSENPGSVKAMYEQFLHPIALQPRIPIISACSSRYQQEVTDWLREEAAAKSQ
jgi:hypothetical protein